MRAHIGVAVAALVLIGSACTRLTPSLTPSPSPTQPAAAGDGGWPTVVSHPIQSNEAPIAGHIAHANGTPATHYCVILTAGPCAVTTDANGDFTTSFLPSIAVTLVIKGQFDGSDGPVVATTGATAGGGPISITVP